VLPAFGGPGGRQSVIPLKVIGRNFSFIDAPVFFKRMETFNETRFWEEINEESTCW
jgi:hypothetical protein